MKRVWRRCALALTVLAGCGQAGPTQNTGTGFSFDRQAARSPAEQAAAFPANDAEVTALPAAEQLAGENGAAVVRKIVYKANVDLVCDDFSAVVAGLESLVATSGGFVADSSISGSAGERRWGEWTLRLPVGRFETLLADLKRLAEVRSARTTSDDVSEEYYDVEARIHNKQREEGRLLRLLDERTAKLEQVLAVEREISRVRGEVEQLQARLRVLSNLTELATVTVRIEEVQEYRPETAPGFTVRFARNVRQSIEALLGVVQAVVIAMAVALPWLLPIGASLLVGRWLLHWRRPARRGLAV